MASSHGISLSAAPLLKLKLCYLKRAKLFLLSAPSELSFSKLLSLVAQAFPETQNVSSAYSPRHRRNSPSSPHIHQPAHIELSYLDADGDSVVIDSDESLSLAALSFNLDVIKLQIHVKDSHSIIDDYDIDKISDLTSMNTPSASSTDRRAHIPCRYFQAGSCKFGSSCLFLHQATCNKVTNSKSGLLLEESEIDRWLMTQKMASEHENISYLSSQDGNDSLMQILNHPHLPRIAIHQLAGLLTRPKFRTSLLKTDTDKIYNCLIGSQFLSSLHSHIRSSVKPILGCVEPYVFLCEEIMGRTSNGWKEVPLDELKALVDEVQNTSARELSHIIAGLLDERADKKWTAAVEEEMGALSLHGAAPLPPVFDGDEALTANEAKEGKALNNEALGKACHNGANRLLIENEGHAHAPHNVHDLVEAHNKPSCNPQEIEACNQRSCRTSVAQERSIQAGIPALFKSEINLPRSPKLASHEPFTSRKSKLQICHGSFVPESDKIFTLDGQALMNTATTVEAPANKALSLETLKQPALLKSAAATKAITYEATCAFAAKQPCNSYEAVTALSKNEVFTKALLSEALDQKALLKGATATKALSKAKILGLRPNTDVQRPDDIEAKLAALRAESEGKAIYKLRREKSHNKKRHLPKPLIQKAYTDGVAEDADASWAESADNGEALFSMAIASKPPSKYGVAQQAIPDKALGSKVLLQDNERKVTFQNEDDEETNAIVNTAFLASTDINEMHSVLAVVTHDGPIQRSASSAHEANLPFGIACLGSDQGPPTTEHGAENFQLGFFFNAPRKSNDGEVNKRI